VLTLRGRFDPGSTVQLVAAQDSAMRRLRPDSAAEVVATSTADASGTALFDVTVSRSKALGGGFRRSKLWVTGRKDHQPVWIRAVHVDPEAIQVPVQPDRRQTARSPHGT
jgi:hypothetical protein